MPQVLEYVHEGKQVVADLLGALLLLLSLTAQTDFQVLQRRIHAFVHEHVLLHPLVVDQLLSSGFVDAHEAQNQLFEAAIDLQVSEEAQPEVKSHVVQLQLLEWSISRQKGLKNGLGVCLIHIDLH